MLIVWRQCAQTHTPRAASEMSEIQDNASVVKVLPGKRGECAAKSNISLFALLITPYNSVAAAAAVKRNVQHVEWRLSLMAARRQRK